MLTLTAKLNELDGDGLFLVRLLTNERYTTIEGATVRLDKFSEIHLRSKITLEERTRMFDANGNLRRVELDAVQEKLLQQQIKMYGNNDIRPYSFSPIIEMYTLTSECVHCRNFHKHGVNTNFPHGWTLGSPKAPSAEQINRLGRYAKWYMEFGEFEPIAPRETDREAQTMIGALFGKRGSGVSIDAELYRATPKISNN